MNNDQLHECHQILTQAGYTLTVYATNEESVFKIEKNNKRVGGFYDTRQEAFEFFFGNHPELAPAYLRPLSVDTNGVLN